MINEEPLVIGIVAGEVSGDSLGADFMRQMNALTENIRWVGVGGSQMQEQGLEPLFDMSRLAVMGLVEVVKHLPDLFRARDELLNLFMSQGIECFIGIDAPDFNLRLGKKLKPKGIYCVQYVSPSIWAWRENRIQLIMQATDLVLCLFPFELPVYEKYNHPAVCVGHPLLDTIDKELQTLDTPEIRKEFIWKNPFLLEHFARRDQGVSEIIAVMPGSRRGEIQKMLPIMLNSIEELIRLDQNLYFVIPAVSHALETLIYQILDDYSPKVKNVVGVLCNNSISNLSQQVMAMSDIVLLASGTATLEAMLIHRPMVVIYQLNTLTYHLVRHMIRVPYVALPNILADDEIVPELIQKEASAENIARELWQTLTTRAYNEQVQHLKQTSNILYQQSNQNPAHVFIEYFTLMTE